MSRRLPLFGWALCLLPIACSSSGAPSAGPGDPSPSAAASAGSDAAAGSSGETQASGAGAFTGLSSSGSGGIAPPVGSGSGSGSGGGSSIGSSGSGASSSGAPTGTGSGGSSGGTVPLGDGGQTTQSKTVPDIFADAGAYSPPAVAGPGAHHPGESCSQLGCHGPLGPEDGFLIGGTVFKDYAGTIPNPGVEVRVQDANGWTYTTYSGNNGNFYIGGGAGLALPALVAARDSTTTRPMVTPLTTAGMSSCASAGCHVVGGSPSTGAYYPIHVP